MSHRLRLIRACRVLALVAFVALLAVLLGWDTGPGEVPEAKKVVLGALAVVLWCAVALWWFLGDYGREPAPLSPEAAAALSAQIDFGIRTGKETHGAIVVAAPGGPRVVAVVTCPEDYVAYLRSPDFRADHLMVA